LTITLSTQIQRPYHHHGYEIHDELDIEFAGHGYKVIPVIELYMRNASRPRQKCYDIIAPDNEET
jgi:hypothetical protein